ncbi:hypothetical protein CR157_17485 [Halomonas sp. LBP4]|nr:hypothetical protein CR157_17485 [Halomonas sp. LBP4]
MIRHDNFLDIYRNQRRNPFLFASSHVHARPVSKTAISTNLQNFISYHNIRFNGKLWPIATHQFRKKFARLAVRSGMGYVELKDQFKHYDIEMTKVYGDINIYSELQAEKFKLSQEKYNELFGSQIPIIGGGAKEVLSIRKKFIGMTKKEKASFLSTLPIKALIEQTDDGLCMYRPKKALCGGDLSNCRPADCNNAILPAISLYKTLEWRKSENARMLSFFKNNEQKTEYLRRRNEEINKLLAQLDEINQD